MIRICSRCNLPKEENADNFYLRANSDKFRSVCIECCLADKKKKRADNLENFLQRESDYRTNNLDKIKQVNKNYRSNNVEKEKLRLAEYRENNHDKIKEYSRKYFNDRRKDDVEYRLRNTVSISVGRELKKNGLTKSGSILRFLPYSIDELKAHLEGQFEPWMNWNNYGAYKKTQWDDDDVMTWTWQIDHIIPHSTFKYSSMSDPEFLKCWDLSNLRPLSSKINVIDGVSRKRHKM